MARASLAHLPTHGSREVLVIFGSLTTCDPDDINKTLENLEKDRSIWCNLKRTSFQRAIVRGDLTASDIQTDDEWTSGPKTQSSSLIQMGFPNKISHDHHSVDSSSHSFCACHSKLQSTGSPHLARSYRHLFPVGNWIEKNSNSLSDEKLKCFGCDKELHINKPTQSHGKNLDNGTRNNVAHNINSSINLYHCPRCKNLFCYDCDLYHEQLGLCPGCC
ncbi:hypothetical protein KEM48_002876 [Puccinia striiformis f. sp. tritici PST-130]|nr:hypothetical protein KEM48_002876 [Puccinia striiformis f. sp. tritici PST-130]